jgi:uncharacterized protein (UPF0335 family)
VSDSVNAGQLRAFIERIERLEEEKKALADDIKDVYAEAKGNGFDTKALRKIVALRRQDEAKRREEEEILNVYLAALGMLADTPLGEAAITKAQQSGAKRSPKSFKAEATAAITQALGTPTALTDKENADGYTAAFIGQDGQRVAVGVNVAIPAGSRQ